MPAAPPTPKASPPNARPSQAVRAGDTLVVPELDRLARSVPNARDIGDSLVDRGVRLSLGGTIYDPTDPLGRCSSTSSPPSPSSRPAYSGYAPAKGCRRPREGQAAPRPTSRAVHRLPSHRVPGPRTPPRHRSLNRRGTPIVVFALEATATPGAGRCTCPWVHSRRSALLWLMRFRAISVGYPLDSGAATAENRRPAWPAAIRPSSPRRPVRLLHRRRPPSRRPGYARPVGSAVQRRVARLGRFGRRSPVRPAAAGYS